MNILFKKKKKKKNQRIILGKKVEDTTAYFYFPEERRTRTRIIFVTSPLFENIMYVCSGLVAAKNVDEKIFLGSGRSIQAMFELNAAL